MRLRDLVSTIRRITSSWGDVGDLTPGLIKDHFDNWILEGLLPKNFKPVGVIACVTGLTRHLTLLQPVKELPKELLADCCEKALHSQRIRRAKVSSDEKVTTSRPG
jgi:hypothetical protein